MFFKWYMPDQAPPGSGIDNPNCLPVYCSDSPDGEFTQIGQAGWEDEQPDIAVEHLCKFICGSRGVDTFHVWDDCEQTWCTWHHPRKGDDTTRDLLDQARQLLITAQNLLVLAHIGQEQAWDLTEKGIKEFERLAGTQTWRCADEP